MVAPNDVNIEVSASNATGEAFAAAKVGMRELGAEARQITSETTIDIRGALLGLREEFGRSSTAGLLLQSFRGGGPLLAFGIAIRELEPAFTMLEEHLQKSSGFQDLFNHKIEGELAGVKYLQDAHEQYVKSLKDENDIKKLMRDQDKADEDVNDRGAAQSGNEFDRRGAGLQRQLDADLERADEMDEKNQEYADKHGGQIPTELLDKAKQFRDDAAKAYTEANDKLIQDQKAAKEKASRDEIDAEKKKNEAILDASAKLNESQLDIQGKHLESQQTAIEREKQKQIEAIGAGYAGNFADIAGYTIQIAAAESAAESKLKSAQDEDQRRRQEAQKEDQKRQEDVVNSLLKLGDDSPKVNASSGLARADNAGLLTGVAEQSQSHRTEDQSYQELRKQTKYMEDTGKYIYSILNVMMGAQQV